MAWTTPKTWAVDELITATNLNTHLRDNLNALKSPPKDLVDISAANYTVGSTSWQDVDAALTLSLTTAGGDVLVGFVGSISHSSTNNIYFGLEVDSVDYVADDGICMDAPGTVPRTISFVYRLSGLAAGAYTIVLRWKVSAGTGTMYAGASGAGQNVHPQFWAQELG